MKAMTTMLLSAFLLAGAVPVRATDVFQAVRDGDVEAVKKILEKDPKLANRESATGERPLHYAAHYGRLKIATMLLAAGAKPGSRDDTGDTPLHLAAHLCYRSLDKDKKLKIAKALVAAGAKPDEYNYGAEGNRTPLHEACRQRNMPVATFLISKGADVNKTDARGQGPLYFAAWCGNLKLARLLVAKGAKVKVANSLGTTPFHAAVRSGNDAVIDFLVESGAAQDARNKCGHSAAHFALESGKMKMVKRYPLENAQIKAKLDCGQTVLHCAARGGNPDIVRLVLEKGAPTDVVDKSGHSALHIAAIYGGSGSIGLLLEKGVDPQLVCKHGRTALHGALRYGQDAAVRLLVGKKGRHDGHDEEGNMPLHLAAAYCSSEVVKTLLDTGAKVNVPDATSSTPLHRAAYAGRKKSILLLLEKGAYTRIKNMEGHTPAAAARATGFEKIAEAIERWDQAHPEARKSELPAAAGSATSKIAAIRKYRGNKYVLIIAPFGKVDAELLAAVQARLQRLLGISVLVQGEGIALPSAEEATRRKFGHRQWDVEKLLDALRKHVGYHGKSRIGVIGVTGDDIYGSGYNFLFGMAQRGKGVAVMSYNRFHTKDRKKLLKRTLNQAVSSTGLLFGIGRCREKKCPRCYPKSVSEHDKKSDVLCRQCEEGFTKKFGVAGKPLYVRPEENEIPEVF